MEKTYKYNRRHKEGSSLGVIVNTPEARKLIRQTNKKLAAEGCTFRVRCRYRGPQALRSQRSGEALAKTAPLMALYVQAEEGTLSVKSLRFMGRLLHNIEAYIVG